VRPTDDPAIRRATKVMAGYGRPWGIAGGWAIDLFLDSVTRRHADLDVAMLHVDQLAVRAHLAGAVVRKVSDGALTDWPAGEELPRSIHEVWATWPDGWQLELLLDGFDARTTEWVFRRDARVRMALGDAFQQRHETRFVAPEIVLLYKAKNPAQKDADDFHRVAPLLTPERRAWLHGALTVAHPGHAWGEHLERDSRQGSGSPRSAP
jgi:hypothetical protein